MITTRGFTGRPGAKADRKRIPPGQYLTEDFPVLSAGPTPHTPLDRWTLTLQDGGSLVGKWTWEEFNALPRTELTVDIHCVTKWSKLGTVWEGVTIDDLLAAAGPAGPPRALPQAPLGGRVHPHPAVREPAGWQGPGGDRVRGGAAGARARRPGASPGP